MRRSTAKVRVAIAAVLAGTLLGLGWTAAAEGERAGAPGVAAPPSPERMVVTGTVEALDKNLLGQATKVQIVSSAMGNFLIADTGKGQELKKHVGETVTVTAQRQRDAEGNEILSVERYEIRGG